MATEPPLVGRTVEHRIGDVWVPVRIVEQNGGSIVALVVTPIFPNGSPRITATFPLAPSDWRL